MQWGESSNQQRHIILQNAKNRRDASFNESRLKKRDY